MYAPDTDYDLIAPATGRLLAEIGIDADAVRESIADDRARRCPDRRVPADGVLADGVLADGRPTILADAVPAQGSESRA